MKYEFHYSHTAAGHQMNVIDAITRKPIAHFFGETKEIAEMNLIQAFIVLSDFTGKEDLKEIATDFVNSYELPDVLK